MDTIDRFDSNLPVPFPAASPSPSGLAPAFSRDLATTPSFNVSARVILRGLTRHWWHILLLWSVVFTPVGYLIYRSIEPTYEAFSTLRVEPTQPEIFGSIKTGLVESRSVATYLETQVNLITSDRVLKEVVANPLVVRLPVVTASNDPKADLRKKMFVENIGGTFLIRVALELPAGEDAAAIVDTVVETYIRQNNEYNRGANMNLQKSLQVTLVGLERLIKEKKEELDKLVQEGKVVLAKPVLNPSLKNDNDQTLQPTFSSLTEEQLQRTLSEMFKTQLDLIEAQSMLDVLEKQQAEDQANQEHNAHQLQQIDEKLKARIEEEFQKDPTVVALIGELHDAREQLDHAKAVARLPNDSARRAAEKQHKKLTEQYEELWEVKYEEIGKRLQAAAGTLQPPRVINELKIKVESLKKKRESQVKMFEEVKVENKTTNSGTFNAMLLNHELNSLMSQDDQVKKNLGQLQFEANQDIFRVVLQDKASVPKNPTNNKLVKYMAAAPVGILFMVLGLFFLLEIKAQRVDDPDVLSTRVRSEVYALPPLPTTRSIRKMSVPEADDQIEQFIQRLDHLRFGVCGNPAELGKGRCVLITSAVGGEGKTTLAAQLAARCGNAGMSTLLIDADLRRAALCRLLDVPEGPGLSDVLKDEATIDEVVIPVQEGTFYLLSAGTPIKDTSRVLQNRNFGLLITHLRQLYDLIIIDSPPVLPVPDALIVGRCADGAVLAARYDISRFPQVERARRQLDGAGIAILGTVINGMRHSESYYGRYSYSRQRSSQPNSSKAI